MALVNLSLTLNGEHLKVQVEEDKTLLYLIREVLGLKGTKEGCGEGDCGACTVLLDGKAVNSCLVLAVQAEGRELTTIEGLGTPEKLHPLQQAFVEEGAIQCGFCTPGMLLSAKAFLDANPNPDVEQIRLSISGNLCRCTGYSKILTAIQKASRIIAESTTGKGEA